MFTSKRRRYREDVSLVSQWLGYVSSVRAGHGSPVPYDQLPITQGTASLIADAIAVMDLYAVDERTGQRVSEDYTVLRRPSPDESRGESLVKIVQSMFWTGNAGAMNGPRDSSGAVDAITVLNPDHLSAIPHPEDDLLIQGWRYNQRTFVRSDITHWKLNDDPRRGPMGESPLRRCSTALDTYGWAYRYLADFFANGGNPSHTLKSKVELAPEKITELATEWVDARQQRRPAFIPNWLDYSEGSGANDLHSVVEVLSFAAAEVARALNLPVSLVNAPTAGYSLQYRNTNDEFRRWLAVSLGTTWMARIERGFSTLLPDGHAARLDPSPLYRSDLFPDTAPPEATPLAPPREVGAPTTASEVPS